MRRRSCIFIHRFDDGAQKQQELRVFVRAYSPGSSRFTPVSVEMDQLLCLPLPLTPAKGFSCSRQTRPCCGGHFFHHLHRQLVVVGSDVGGGENGRQLVLGGRHLVVLGFGEHAQLPQLFVQILHKGA